MGRKPMLGVDANHLEQWLAARAAGRLPSNDDGRWHSAQNVTQHFPCSDASLLLWAQGGIPILKGAKLPTRERTVM
jgi:hypothetical protein